MTCAFDRLNHDHQGLVTSAAVEYPARTRSLLHRDRAYPHTPLKDDADDVLRHLRQLGWPYVVVRIHATHIPTFTQAVYAIDELLAGRPQPPHLS